MKYVTEGREPADALRFFEDISAIPRASRNEAGIAAFMKKFAEDRGLWVKGREYKKMVLKKAGGKGWGGLAPRVLLWRRHASGTPRHRPREEPGHRP